MRFVNTAFALAFTVLMAATAPAAIAQTQQPRDVIGAQLQAFQDDDFETGFTYASPFIQSIFGNVATFERMVTSDYPMVHRPQSIRYLDQITRQGQLVQRVLITDQQGRVFTLEYEMIGTGDAMRINGVRILPTGAGV